MKKIIFLIAFITICIRVEAYRGAPRILVFPISTEISENSIFIIETNCYSQFAFDSLNVKYSIYLQSGSGKIKLNVVEVRQGMFHSTQVLLKPESPLVINRKYKMIIDSLDVEKYGSIHKWNPMTKESSEPEWLVTENTDLTLPTYEKPPKFKKTFLRSSSSTEVYCIYKSFVNAELEIIYDTEVRVLRRDTPVFNYYIPLIKNEELKVGHLRCSGGFDFDRKNNYQVRFRLLDFSGNSNRKWTEWAELKNPFKD